MSNFIDANPSEKQESKKKKERRRYGFCCYDFFFSFSETFDHKNTNI